MWLAYPIFYVLDAHFVAILSFLLQLKINIYFLSHSLLHMSSNRAFQQMFNQMKLYHLRIQMSQQRRKIHTAGRGTVLLQSTHVHAYRSIVRLQIYRCWSWFQNDENFGEPFPKLRLALSCVSVWVCMFFWFTTKQLFIKCSISFIFFVFVLRNHCWVTDFLF